MLFKSSRSGLQLGTYANYERFGDEQQQQRRRFGIHFLRTWPQPRRAHVVAAIAVLTTLLGITLWQLQPEILFGEHWESLGKGADAEGWFFKEPSTRFSKIERTNTTADEEIDPCDAFPKYMLSTVQVVLKTGVGESRLPRTQQHLDSVTRCIDNLIVASDAEYDIGRFRAHDVLKRQVEYGRLSAQDEKTYRAQKAAFDSGAPTRTEHGWDLDRYKFLPMIQHAHRANPTAQWFVFLELDTYLVWDNLFRLLDNFDPRDPHYFGSPSPGRTPPDAPIVSFAYGGTGFVLSVGAVERLLDRKKGADGQFLYPDIAGAYQRLVREDCCGDSMLAYVLWEKAGIRIQGFWPLFSPEEPHRIPYTETFWCKPVVAMHRVRAEEMVSLWDFENRRGRKKPLLYADLASFAFGLAPNSSFSSSDDDDSGTAMAADNWDNNADAFPIALPASSRAHDSPDSCARGCADESECLQWRWHGGRCNLSRYLRLGDAHPDGDAGKYVSGWDWEGIERWRARMACKETEWVAPSSERIF